MLYCQDGATHILVNPVLHTEGSAEGVDGSWHPACILLARRCTVAESVRRRGSLGSLSQKGSFFINPIKTRYAQQSSPPPHPSDMGSISWDLKE